MRFLKFVGKMVLKLVALPVLFVLGLICLLAKLVVNVSSFAIGALILYILGCCIYCVFQSLWLQLGLLVGIGLAVYAVLFLFVLFQEIGEQMIESLKGHVDRFKQETQCKNYDIALISFEDTLLIPQNVEKLSSLLGKKMYVLKNRQTSSLSRSIKTDDPIILSDPYNVNGLEFKCVILFGVDEGRLPQNTGVSDISANYIKYIAFNQLYLASSRAKYRLILIGNSLHGVSSCLQYALESGKLETGDQV